MRSKAPRSTHMTFADSIQHAVTTFEEAEVWDLDRVIGRGAVSSDAAHDEFVPIRVEAPDVDVPARDRERNASERERPSRTRHRDRSLGDSAGSSIESDELEVTIPPTGR